MKLGPVPKLDKRTKKKLMMTPCHQSDDIQCLVWLSNVVCMKPGFVGFAKSFI